MSTFHVVVERAAAQDAEAAMADLVRWFHDRSPRLASETARAFFFELMPVHAAQAPADPDLLDTARGLLGIEPNKIADWRQIDDDPATGHRFAVMLEHTHALEAWSGAIASWRETSPTLLLHIDAHDDLNGPSLRPGETERTFEPPIGPGLMALDDPKTVRRMATRGFIGIGGFVAPMIAASAVDIMLHVAGPRDAGGTGESSLEISTEPGTGFIRVRKRPARGHGVAYRRLKLHDAIDAALRFDGRVLLDVDLDAFCNRYDTHGGCDVRDDEAIDALAQTARTLTESGLLQRAVVTTVALSPGFFPAALWPQGLCWAEELRLQCLGATAAARGKMSNSPANAGS